MNIQEAIKFNNNQFINTPNKEIDNIMQHVIHFNSNPYADINILLPFPIKPPHSHPSSNRYPILTLPVNLTNDNNYHQSSFSIGPHLVPKRPVFSPSSPRHFSPRFTAGVP